MPTTTSGIHCEDTAGRRALVVASALNGIDYIEVFGDTLETQRHLHVYFIKPPPPPLAADLEAFSVEGGTRITNIRVVAVAMATDPGGEDYVEVTVDQPGDFSTYTLEINRPELDDAYRRCDFSFKAGCPSRFDCKPKPPPPTAEPPPPVIDYMAKDYASFRQALIDLIPSLAPQWRERLAADFGMTMVELLAYAADQLSYYQDAVANEMFLATARQRVSVRRHARLVDYYLHDGASARTFVQVLMQPGASLALGAAVPLEVTTEIDVPLRSQAAPHPMVLDDALAADARRAAAAVFETMTGGRLDSRLNAIALHDLGNSPCCLPCGATTAVLVDDLTDVLAPGDFLLLEEFKDPETGDPGLPDLDHRQVVRLVRVTAERDELLGKDLTRVEWHPADALAFPLCISAVSEDGDLIAGVSVARGNLLLADHGRRVEGEAYVADPVASGVRVPRFRLDQGPLSFRQQPPAGDRWPVADLFGAEVDGARLLPQVRLSLASGEMLGGSEVFSAACDAAADSGGWEPVLSLLDSDAFDRHVAVETGNDGRALLRFGDGQFGERPPDGASFAAVYRVGVGRAGNIGADALHHLIEPAAMSLSDVVAGVRNPLPAWGGRDPEPIARAKELAPAAFRASQERAVTEADYAQVAARHPSVSTAEARFRWTGSWHTVFISVDPVGRVGLDPGLAADIAEFVGGFAQAGYDFEIRGPRYVPITVQLDICVAPEHFPPDVEEAVRDVLTGAGAVGDRPFFHPDNFTFGQPLYLSTLLAAVEAVEGVESVLASRFARLDDHDPSPGFPVTRTNVDQGYLEVAGLEIVRLDDDPNFPGFGQLRLVLQGGRGAGLGGGGHGHV